MKRNFIVFTLILSLLTVGSCKKDKATSKAKTTAELLIGEWDIHHEAEDDNDNGVMEESEVYIRSGDQQWVFEENGHAAMTYYTNGNVPHQDAHSYTLDGNELSITSSGSSYVAKYTIEQISETELKWRTTSFSETVWRMYGRTK
jgi:hypothetical protein